MNEKSGLVCDECLKLVLESMEVHRDDIVSPYLCRPGRPLPHVDCDLTFKNLVFQLLLDPHVRHRFAGRKY